MNVQEIFNRVIDQGYYDISFAHTAMCHSLNKAWDEEAISEEEYQLACEQIEEYLLTADCAYLFTALRNAGLPHTIEARTAIYRDWANRPNLLSTI